MTANWAEATCWNTDDSSYLAVETSLLRGIPPPCKEPPRQLGRLVPGRRFCLTLSKEDRMTEESERLRWLYVRKTSKRRKTWAVLNTKGGNYKRWP